jgi:hypothetical protein
MKKIYRNQLASPKPKKKTRVQLRREWEYTIIAGGMVRASAFPRTANILNRGRGAMVRVLAVPLTDDRQMKYLEEMSDEGIVAQTPEEAAAWLITEGLMKRIKQKMKCQCCGRLRSNDSKDAKP